MIQLSALYGAVKAKFVYLVTMEKYHLQSTPTVKQNTT